MNFPYPLMTHFVKIFVKLVSALAILAGIAGFFVTDIMGIATDTIQNIIFIVVGILGVNASGTYGKARMFLILFGLLFGVLAVIGLVNSGNILGYYQTNVNGSLLHLGISAIFLIMGLGSRKKA